MDAYSAALALLSRRELSSAQLRERLARRGHGDADIDAALAKLTREGALDDRRVAVAAARQQAAVRGRGRRRVLQELQRLGIDSAIAREAIDAVFADLDESALLDRALARRLRGAAARTLDAKAQARLVRALVAQGFDSAQVLARLRHRGGETAE
jgi:regulatory protein